MFLEFRVCTEECWYCGQGKEKRWELSYWQSMNLMFPGFQLLSCFKAPSLSFYLFSVTPNLNKAYALQRLLEDINFEVEKLLSSERAWKSDKQVWCLIIFAHRRSGAQGTPVANSPSAEDWEMHPGFPGELFNLCRKVAGVCQVPTCAAETPVCPYCPNSWDFFALKSKQNLKL